MGKTMQDILEKELLQGSKDRYGIYRLRRKEEYHRYMYCSLLELNTLGITPTREMYALIYVGEPLDEKMDLERIFEKYNLNHPEDFLSASLSVGDIIVTRKGDKVTVYFVNPVGFAELPDFFVKAESIR